ncbi:MAG TPA: S8 family serine peptidase [Oligoflexia bacterium]|nr:S8 family serine peptidase [Oligoflexia bacterium]HMP26509.1 S8 family serine peptidase [Oligoflexia bacterium]
MIKSSSNVLFQKVSRLYQIVIALSFIILNITSLPAEAQSNDHNPSNGVILSARSPSSTYENWIRYVLNNVAIPSQNVTFTKAFATPPNIFYALIKPANNCSDPRVLRFISLAPSKNSCFLNSPIPDDRAASFAPRPDSMTELLTELIKKRYAADQSSRNTLEQLFLTGQAKIAFFIPPTVFQRYYPYPLQYQISFSLPDRYGLISLSGERRNYKLQIDSSTFQRTFSSIFSDFGQAFAPIPGNTTKMIADIAVMPKFNDSDPNLKSLLASGLPAGKIVLFYDEYTPYIVPNNSLENSPTNTPPASGGSSGGGSTGGSSSGGGGSLPPPILSPTPSITPYPTATTYSTPTPSPTPIPPYLKENANLDHYVHNLRCLQNNPDPTDEENPLLKARWYLQATNAYQAWTLLKRLEYQAGRRRGSVKLAIIADTIDTSIQEFLGRTGHPGNYWVNHNEPANNLDDDGNGIIDDHRGAIFNGLTGEARGLINHNSPFGLAGTYADVALSMGGFNENNRYHPEIKIISVGLEPFYPAVDFPLGPRGLQEALSYAAKVGDIILVAENRNIPDSVIHQSQIEQIITANPNKLFVVSSGFTSQTTGDDRNLDLLFRGDKNKIYPARLANNVDNLLTVAATTRDLDKFQQNFFGHLSLIATPGSLIQYFVTMSGNGAVSARAGNGPNFSAAIVAGALAQILSLFPELTPYELKRLARDTAVPLRQLDGYTRPSPCQAISTSNPNGTIFNFLSAVKGVIYGGRHSPSYCSCALSGIISPTPTPSATPTPGGSTSGGSGGGLVGGLPGGSGAISAPQATATAQAYGSNCRLEKTPNDPLFSEQWALKNSGTAGALYDSDINIPNVWARLRPESYARVAIISTGLDIYHPDLQQILVPNPNERLDGRDTDGNGCINDITLGCDVSSAVNSHGDFSANNIAGGGQGTEIAGIIAANSNNGIGIAGMLWGIKTEIIPIKVAASNSHPVDPMAMRRAFEYAYSTNPDVIVVGVNCSGPACKTQVDSANISPNAKRTTVVVAAAGEDYQNSGLLLDLPVYSLYPAKAGAYFVRFLTAGAVSSADTRPWWSNYGPAFVVGAPGVENWTTTLGGNYNKVSGSHIAAAHAAGLAALMISQQREIGSGAQLLGEKVVQKIKDTLRSSSELRGVYLPARCDNSAPNGGIINASAAENTTCSKCFVDLPPTPTPIPSIPPSVASPTATPSSTLKKCSEGWTDIEHQERLWSHYVGSNPSGEYKLLTAFNAQATVNASYFTIYPYVSHPGEYCVDCATARGLCSAFNYVRGACPLGTTARTCGGGDQTIRCGTFKAVCKL